MAARMRFGHRGAIIHASSGAGSDAFCSMFSIGHAGGSENGTRLQFTTIAQGNTLVTPVQRHSRDGHGDQEFRTKTLRLSHSPACQLAATDAGGKPQIVFDSRTRACLASWPMSIKEESPDSLGRAINCGGQTGWTGSHDHKVIHIVGSCCCQAEVFRDFLQVRISKHRSVLQNDCGQLTKAHLRYFEETPRIRIALSIQPSIRNEIARKKILHLMRAGRPLVPEKPEAGYFRAVFRLP